jgi:hypothetical protein
MQTPADYRAKADEYAALASGTADAVEAKKLMERSRSFTTLAENAEWLVEHRNFDIHIQIPNLNTAENNTDASEGGPQLTR